MDKMERYGSCICCPGVPDWAVSLPGNGAAAASGPYFSAPASRLFIGKILWIAGMFECAVKRAAHGLRFRAGKTRVSASVRVAVCKAICRFKL